MEYDVAFWLKELKRGHGTSSTGLIMILLGLQLYSPLSVTLQQAKSWQLLWVHHAVHGRKREIVLKLFEILAILGDS